MGKSITCLHTWVISHKPAEDAGYMTLICGKCWITVDVVKKTGEVGDGSISGSQILHG